MLRKLSDNQIKAGVVAIILTGAGYYLYEAKKNMDEIEKQQ